MSEEDLLAVRNFGEKSLTELKDSLQDHHLLPTQPQIDAYLAGQGAGEED
jgi:DNA-directed RNA polymerase alpha subunit